MLASLLAAFASGETLYAVRRMRRAAVAYGVAAVFALVGIGFLVGAGYIAAADAWGPIVAALIFAGAFFLVAVIVVIAHRVGEASRLRELERKRSAEMTTIGTAAALAVLPSVLRGKAGAAAVVAPAIAVGAYSLYRFLRRGPKPDLPRRRR